MSAVKSGRRERQGWTWVALADLLVRFPIVENLLLGDRGLGDRLDPF